jgi:hypothetical protein
MEKRSTHYGDVEKWVEKVINSCETYQQTFVVKQLILNFERQMGRNKVDFDTKWGIQNSLRLKLQFKRDELLKNSL